MVLGLVLAAALVLLRDPVAGLAGRIGGSIGGRASDADAGADAGVRRLVTLFDGLQVVGAMGLRAQGVVWLPTIIHVGSYIVVMLPLCVWLAFTPETAPPSNNLLGAFLFWPAHWPGAMGLGVWGVFIGISIASVLAGLGQIVALEIKSARGVRLGPPDEATRKAAAVVH